jgi:hypothetical protein
VLPVFSVESLYYSRPVLDAVATQQSKTLGASAIELLASAAGLALDALQSVESVQHLASRVSERQMRDKLLRAMPNRAELVGAQGQPISVEIESPFPAELQKLVEMREGQDIDRIVARYPVRESGVLSALAKGLRFLSRGDFERAALTRIGADQELRAKLRIGIGPLAGRLV